MHVRKGMGMDNMFSTVWVWLARVVNVHGTCPGMICTSMGLTMEYTIILI